RDFLLLQVAYLLGYFHRTEFRAAHGTEMGDFSTFGRQGLVMELTGRIGIEGKVELVFPAELESRFAQGIIPVLRSGMAFGQVCSMCSNLIGDNPGFYVFFIGK